MVVRDSTGSKDNTVTAFLRLLRRSAYSLLFLTLYTLPVWAQDTAVQDNPSTWWVWNFLGRLHPLAVHFPVALLLFAAVLELFTLKRFHHSLRAGIRVCLAAGAISSIFAAIAGWLLFGSDEYSGTTISVHQWTGMGTVVLSLVAWWLAYRAGRKSNAGAIKVYRGSLFFTAIAVMVAGHYGASLTHGDNYLTSTLPWSGDYDEQVELSGIDFASVKSDSGALDSKYQRALQSQVKSIFSRSCYKCHGPEKVKGDLRLDNKEMIFRGGESGPLFVAGKPEESEIYKRITLPRGHDDVMPQKGKLLSEKQIGVIRTWILNGAPWPQDDKEKVFRTAALEPRNPALPAGTTAGNSIDLWVNEYFKKKKVEWPKVVDDKTYLRRLYLDIVGILPAYSEVEEFIKDTRPDKRAAYARALLNRNDDYAIHWLSFWNDALRNDYTGTGYITDGRTAITQWLYESLQTNKPYDVFVRELINPNKESKGFIDGIRWRGVVNASQRTEIQAAQNVAQVFLGLNLKCASCHNSFINNWKLEDAYAFANVFSDTSLEINRCDKPTGKFTKARMLWEQLGDITDDAPKQLKQQQLAAIMTQPENGRIYRTIVNRVWAKLMGRGIVEPVDVMDNEPWSQDLLDHMAYEFANRGNKDIRELIYQIVTSATYQLPSVEYKDVNRLTANDYVFRGMVRRRLTAEQFADAVGRIIYPVFPDSLMKFNPGVKEAVYLEENSGPRASLVVNNVFLTRLGRPNRETVTTSRESEANLLQALELTNGAQFSRALKLGAARWLQRYDNSDALVTAIYRETFARMPTGDEMKMIIPKLGNQPKQQDVEDLLWSVALLPEFQLIY